MKEINLLDLKAYQIIKGKKEKRHISVFEAYRKLINVVENGKSTENYLKDLKNL